MTIQLRSLILEGNLSNISKLFIKAKDKVKSFFASINPIKLDDFIKKNFKFNKENRSKIKDIFESTKVKEDESFAPSKRIEGRINMTDTCFTAVMRLIGKKNLLDKYDFSGSKFLDGYAEIKAPIRLTNKNISKVKKGTIIIFNYEPDPNKRNRFKMNNMYKKGHLYNNNKFTASSAHFCIVIDPEEYLIMHNSTRGRVKNGEPIGMGSHLELIIQEFPEIFKEPESRVLHALDMNVINKM